MKKLEELDLIFQDYIAPEDAHILNHILEEHNFDETATRRSTLAILLRDGDHRTVGGIVGTIAWGLLYITTLSVHSQFRGQGYGAKLLAAAEQEGMARGCHLAHLHTMSFQAPAFYQKHGYTVFKVLEGEPREYKRYLLEKKLG
ncbi:MAG TPA: GNAT family N-acetyltransferase [Abditibacteriaceae bacterium]|jgi:ribosomal protein S18 acetylase RimI-like enzyme